MKRIATQGIYYIEPLDGSREWYWGMDYTHGDLYEAEEMFRQGHPVSQNKLLFVHYPDGKVVQPVIAEKGQYFGCPICYDNQIILLKADFPAEKIEIIQFDNTIEHMAVLAVLDLSDIEDCYNLMLKGSPLMLTRQGQDNKFQILWPKNTEFYMEDRETFLFGRGEKLYFFEWYDEFPEYREEVIVRNKDTGEIIEKIPGSMTLMPDGQMWILV